MIKRREKHETNVHGWYAIRGWACLLLYLLAPSFVWAQELYEMHRNARAMGMGNAYVSLVDDEESLFYNPAGIAKNGGFFWTIADPHLGISSLEDLDAWMDLQDTDTFESALNNLYGKPIWAGGGAKTAVMVPFFAAALYTDADVSVSIDNPVSPTMTVNYVRDTGIAVGVGSWLGPFLQAGMVLKRINRVGSRRSWGPSVIADIVSGNGEADIIFNNLENKGLGYALDFGANLTLPGPVKPTASFVWRNIGNTKFTPLVDGAEAPPSEKQEWIVGTSLMVDLPLVHIVPSIDFKHVNDQDTQLGKKIHLGLELGLPLVDLRVGLHQGYLSYGAGLNLGLVRVDAASWGVEMGGYPGQMESRRMMVQASIRLGFDFGIGQGGGESGGSGRSGSKSFWGGSKRLKQRR